MKTFIKLFSNKENEIYRFLKNFYSSLENKENDFTLPSTSLLEWKIDFENTIEMVDIIGVFIDNIDDYEINMWICLDEGMLINVTENNVDDLIRYIYERFPY